MEFGLAMRVRDEFEDQEGWCGGNSSRLQPILAFSGHFNSGECASSLVTWSSVGCERRVGSGQFVEESGCGSERVCGVCACVCVCV